MSLSAGLVYAATPSGGFAGGEGVHDDDEAFARAEPDVRGVQPAGTSLIGAVLGSTATPMNRDDEQFASDARESAERELASLRARTASGALGNASERELVDANRLGLVNASDSELGNASATATPIMLPPPPAPPKQPPHQVKAAFDDSRSFAPPRSTKRWAPTTQATARPMAPPRQAPPPAQQQAVFAQPASTSSFANSSAPPASTSRSFAAPSSTTRSSF